jgi:hypothetical protein
MAKAKNTNHASDDLDNDDDIGDPTASSPTPIAASDRSEQRGRPTLSETAARPPKQLIKAVKLEHPMRIGVVCPGCGRVVTPRILRTENTERTVECTSCARRYRVGYNAEGWPVDYRFIR